MNRPVINSDEEQQAIKISLHWFKAYVMQASRLWGHAWNQETKKQKKERERRQKI